MCEIAVYKAMESGCNWKCFTNVGVFTLNDTPKSNEGKK